MTLSTSRQQFLAYETHGTEDIQYGRKGGMFISNCVCVTLIIFAVLVAVIVGVIAHFITFFKLSHNAPVNFWDETEPFGVNGGPSPSLRLPSTIVPSFYRIKLQTDLDNSNFTGEVYITIRPNTKTKEIILHAKNLSINSQAKLTEQIYEQVETVTRTKRQVTENVNNNITLANSNDTLANTNDTLPAKIDTTIAPNITDNNNTAEGSITNPVDALTNVTSTTIMPPTPIDMQVTHSSVREIRIIAITQGTGDRLILLLETAMQADVDYILELRFTGTISNSLTGFYKSSYTNDQKEVKNLGVTQFEPTSARAAFPCFDEPAFKSKFEISIAHPQNISVLSNMRVSTQEPIADQPNWQWTHFERSVSMSTYLVAYVLSDFKYLETSYVSMDNVTKPIRIWTRPELINKANYALTITPKLLDYYEDVFGVPYALDKIDLIAIPDFSSGAMENWGLITFRETTLLFDEAEGVPREKQNVAIDVAHELAHQWFGNLVTMRWWTDLWLNEGFATYIEYVGVDHIEPEWNMLESFSRDKMDLLRSDALKNTSPVSRKVTDASEISQKFDEISYTKGANLIRMLNHTVSEELFHKGLVIYLNDWKYANAEENDLWEAMSKATLEEPSLSGLSVVQFMNSWTRQAGYPVVKINRNYQTGDLELEQRLFTGAKEPYQSMVDQLWDIPISYTTMDAPLDQWSTKPRTWLKERFNVVKTDINETQALYLNVGAIGYYRVNYDQKNWELISTALKSGVVKSPITKAQLIDDAFNLAKASHLNYSYALGLTTCVIDGEDSKLVWDLLLNNMAYLKHNLRSTPGYIYFQDYMKVLLKKQLERLNYGLDKPKDDNEALLIENLVMWECFVESPRCLDWAWSQYNNWTSQENLANNPIPSYLRSLVYSVVIKHGGRREFDFFYDLFNNSTDPGVKSLIITHLSSTREENLISLMLERSLAALPKQYAVAAWGVQAGAGAAAAQAFLRRHFTRVLARFTAMDAFMFPAVLSGAFGFISTTEELDMLKSFALEHKEDLLPMSQTLQKLVDTATLRIAWIQKHADDINNWFRDYLNGNAATSSTISDTITTTVQPPMTVEDVTIASNVTIATESNNVTQSDTPTSR